MEIVEGYHVYAGRHDDLIDDYYYYKYLWEPSHGMNGETGDKLDIEMEADDKGVIRFWNTLCAGGSSGHWKGPMHFKYLISHSYGSGFKQDFEFNF